MKWTENENEWTKMITFLKSTMTTWTFWNYKDKKETKLNQSQNTGIQSGI